MPICDHNMTDIGKEHAQTEPGMAFFAGTGPADKHCGECKSWGYKRTNNKDKVIFTAGCKKYHELTGRHGPQIRANLLACKYFEQGAGQQLPTAAN